MMGTEGSMQRVGSAGQRGGSRRAAVMGVAASVVALLGLAACTSTSGGTGHSPVAHDTTAAPGGSSSTPPSTPPANPAAITTSITSRAISPIQPVQVGIEHGKLTAVSLLNPAGRHVRGELAADGSAWHNTEVLGYSKTYKLTAKGVDDNGAPVTKTATVTTLTPNNLTMPYIQRIGGYPLTEGATYGVAIVPVVHFDEHITNEAAAEKKLHVTTTPHVDGSWYWSDDQNAHYRPESYWPGGTKVTVSAKVYGTEVGQGLYGESDVTRSFTIGRKQVTVAYDTAPKSVNKVRVYNAAGRMIRTMNTSMGEHSGETVNGNYINFYTLDGTYTVLGHEQPANMCSDSYGLPANAPGGYACEAIYNATKISTDGIYLHELLTTIWAQNSGQDVSHGCLNLNAANSLWFFNHSMIGDPVVIHGAAHAPKLEVWQGGDWSVPWSQWLKGSAL
jgi:lipoprotein-anchoring transpeptidase ErfK/SrfK